MTENDAYEQAYRNGYKDGKRDAVVYAEWEMDEEGDCKCTRCGEWQSYPENYCPECGAKMKNNGVENVDQENREAYWIVLYSDGIHSVYKCSDCGKIIMADAYDSNMLSVYPYCHCGAKMIGVKNENESN